MFWKSVLISTILGAQALVEAQQAVTVTQTVYESNQCLENYAKKILQNNPTGLTTGIPVVIVYEPKTEQAGQQQQQQQQQGNKPQSTTKKNPTVAAESQITTVLETRVCQKNGCQVHTYTTAIAAQNSYTTEITTTETEDPTFRTTSVKTAETTTSIIFSATTLPKSTFIPSTSNTISRTSIVNPVSSQSVVSASKSVTIDTSTITGAITIGDESTVVKPSNSTTSHSNSLNGSANSESTTKSNSRLTNASTSSLSSTSRVTSSARTSDPSSSSLGSSDIIDSIDPTFSSVYESTSSSGYLNSTTVESSTESESSLVESSSLESISSETSSDFASSTSSEGASSSSLSSESSESLAPSSSSSASETESETESSSSTEESSEPTIEPKVCYTGDLFRAVDTSAPPSVFTRDQLPLSIPSGVDNNGKPIGTNKFYTNLVINDQNLMVYPLPYALYWSKSTYYGFGVQHINLDQRVFGSQNTNNVGVASYYYDPTNNGEIIFSATSFSESANYMRVTDMTDLSALVTLSSTSNDDTNYLNIPLVQGMGFATAIYNGNLTPLLNSLYGVKELSLETSDALSSNVIKYRATLLNDIEWLIYVTLPSADTEFELEVQDYYNLVGSNSVDGLIIQVAIAPTDEDQDLYYDAAAGTYVTSASVLGNVVCDTDATYRITYQSQGNSSSGSPLVFALPHHLNSLTGDVLDAATGILVPSTTKGNMTGFLTDEFVFSETIQQEVEFLPWLPSLTGPLTYTQDQLTLLASAANHELAVDIRSSVANMDSNYFSGKVIDKYAQILLVVSEIIQDENVTSDALAAMKDAFDVFLENEQYYPLMYDTKFGGVTSTSAQGGDTGADFGAAYYNDHDFHYGYFIHAAAVVGYVDQKLNGTWAEDNKDWVNSLIRDTSNPSADDTYFPISRTFDWYAGHSWATGLFTTYKNIESSSEALHHAAALKLWGKVIGDHSLESRGGLILAIMNRSYNDYFYYKRDNAVEPEQILPNKVSGIFFENKVDYTTFFGAPDEYPQYVHGIHMLPITPSSALARVPSYVQEEWDDQVVSFISNVSDGWLGILRLNQAIIDPRTSYDFFASDDWSDNYLDNGQSRTWSLAFSGIYNSL